MPQVDCAKTLNRYGPEKGRARTDGFLLAYAQHDLMACAVITAPLPHDNVLLDRPAV